MKDTLDGDTHAAVVEALLLEPEVDARVRADTVMSKPPARRAFLSLGVREGHAGEGLTDVRARLHRGGRRHPGTDAETTSDSSESRITRGASGGSPASAFSSIMAASASPVARAASASTLQRLESGEVGIELRRPAFGHPSIDQVAHAARRRERFVGHLEHAVGDQQASRLFADRGGEQAFTLPHGQRRHLARTLRTSPYARIAGTDRAATRLRRS